MQDALDRLVAGLNRREIIDWLPEMKLGRPALDRIRSEIAGDRFTSNQLRNGMHALFRLREHGEEQEIFDLFVQLSASSEKQVRSEAVQLAIGLLRLQRVQPRRPLSATPVHFAALRRAIDLGVSSKVEALAREFMPGDKNA